MSNNRRATELNKYVVERIEKLPGGKRVTYHYCMTQKEAKAWSLGKVGKKYLYKISYDSYGEIK